jgi:hypothetical protein
MYVHLNFVMLEQHLFHVNELSQQLRQALRPIDRLFCLANIAARPLASECSVLFCNPGARPTFSKTGAAGSKPTASCGKNCTDLSFPT